LKVAKSMSPPSTARTMPVANWRTPVLTRPKLRKAILKKGREGGRGISEWLMVVEANPLSILPSPSLPPFLPSSLPPFFGAYTMIYRALPRNPYMDPKILLTLPPSLPPSLLRYSQDDVQSLAP